MMTQSFRPSDLRCAVVDYPGLVAVPQSVEGQPQFHPVGCREQRCCCQLARIRAAHGPGTALDMDHSPGSVLRRQAYDQRRDLAVDRRPGGFG